MQRGACALNLKLHLDFSWLLDVETHEGCLQLRIESQGREGAMRSREVTSSSGGLSRRSCQGVHGRDLDLGHRGAAQDLGGTKGTRERRCRAAIGGAASYGGQKMEAP